MQTKENTARPMTQEQFAALQEAKRFAHEMAQRWWGVSALCNRLELDSAAIANQAFLARRIDEQLTAVLAGFLPLVSSTPEAPQT